ncbi:MAG: hypothetical protein U9R19_16650 [Bacteroidota bacterium]|nr:hypothetical protein [Bacteroidota bacterium]
MSKTSTLFFLFDNRDLENGFIIGTNEFFNSMNDEFSDVIKFLGKSNFEPRPEIIKNVLDYAKND